MAVERSAVPLANLTPNLAVGQPFNPYKLFTGILIPEALVRFRGLSSGAKIAYGRLARYAGENGDCFPSIPTLAIEIGVGATQARAYVHELADRGFITIEQRSGTSCIYTFLWHPAFTGEIGERQKRPPLRKGAGVPQRETGGVPLRKTGPPPLRKTGDEESQLKESHSKAPERAGREKQRTHTSTSIESREFIVAGWSNSEDFEGWWINVVRNHPNKNRNAIAKTLAIELIQCGILERSEFEEGYSTLKSTNAEQWAEQNGRFAPNLHQLLDDRLWQHARTSAHPRAIAIGAGGNEPADDYLRRVGIQ